MQSHAACIQNFGGETVASHARKTTVSLVRTLQYLPGDSANTAQRCAVPALLATESQRMCGMHDLSKCTSVTITVTASLVPQTGMNVWEYVGPGRNLSWEYRPTQMLDGMPITCLSPMRMHVQRQERAPFVKLDLTSCSDG